MMMSGRVTVLVIIWIASSAWIGFGKQMIYEDHLTMNALIAEPLRPTVAARSLARGSLWMQAHANHDARHFRFVNVILAGLVAVLTGVLAQQLGLWGWLAGGVMALHPLRTETVALLSGRAELIAALGVLCACLWAMRSIDAWSTWFGIAGSLGVGVLGKETALVGLVPVAILLAHGVARRMQVAAVVALLVLGSVAWGFRHYPQVPSAAIASHDWMRTQAAATTRLLTLSLAPSAARQTIDADYDAWPMPARTHATLAIVSLGVLGLWLFCTRPSLAFGLTLMMAVALPRIIVHTPRSYFTEHHWYLALVGFSVGVAAVFSEPRES